MLLRIRKFKYIALWIATLLGSYIIWHLCSMVKNMKSKKVLHTLVIPIFSFFIVVYSDSGFSACGSAESFCYHFKKDKLVKSSKCTEWMCANVHGGSSGWTWPNGDQMWERKGDAEYGESGTFFNEKPANFFKRNYKKHKNMSCFRLLKKNEVFCGVKSKQSW